MTTRAPALCHQCGLPAPRPVSAELEGQVRPFCCPGCREVALLVAGLGLSAFYRLRDGFGPGPAEGPRGEPVAWQATAATASERAGRRELVLAVHGLRCAACVWLIERALAQLPGVVEAAVNLTSGRLRLGWDPAVTDLAQLVAAVEALGYRCAPDDPAGGDARARQEATATWTRLAVAGFGLLSAMFVGDPLVLGGFSPKEAALRGMLAWTGLLVAAPSLGYAGWPFFAGAARALRARRLSMDVTISVAVLAAFTAGTPALWGAHPAVGLDCALELVFLLLIGRALEASARRRVGRAAAVPWDPAGTVATVVGPDGPRRVAAQDLEVGLRLALAAGDRIPADGVVLAGRVAVDEALLTGEPLPASRGPGETLAAGTRVMEGACEIVTTRVGDDATGARLARWVEGARSGRGPSERLADRLGAAVLPVLLAVAALTTWFAWPLGADIALRRAIAVLLVGCPCAFGLATPTAVAVAMAAGSRRGLLFKSAEALERLSQVTHVVLDKTGTLTTGAMRVRWVSARGNRRPAEVLALAAAVEADAEHPVARAILAEARRAKINVPGVTERRVHPGLGVVGRIGGHVVRVGAAGWFTGGLPADLVHPEADATAAYVAVDGEVEGVVALSDALRPDAVAVVSALLSRGVETHLLSGDRDPAVQALGARVGLPSDGVRARHGPDAKAAFIQGLRRPGRVVAMVGDGVNDAPALAAADLGVVVGREAGLAVEAAAVVLPGDRLGALLDALELSARTRSVVRQGLALGVLYNAVALPIAALGRMSPQVAALLMPLSSLLVLANALRLGSRYDARPGRTIAEDRP